MRKLTQQEWLTYLDTIIFAIEKEACGHRKAMTRDFIALYTGVSRLSKTIRNANTDSEWVDRISKDLTTAFDAVRGQKQYKGLSLNLPDIEEKIKVEKTRLIPPNLPEKRGRGKMSERFYDFYRIWLYPIERLMRLRFLRFKIRRCVDYNSHYFLDHIFHLTEEDFRRVSEESEFVLKQVKDVLDFAIEGQTTETPENIQGGLRRAAALIDPLLSDFMGIKAKTRGMMESAINDIRRNVIEESMLARTTAEDIIWTGRMIDHTFDQIGGFFKSIWKLRLFFTRSGEEVARNVPKVFERIERTISLEEGTSSFLLELNHKVDYPEELSRIFSQSPAEVPIFFGREDILRGLAAEYTRFKSGGISLVVMTGGAGAGKRSIIKYAMKEWRDTLEWEIERRITDPLELDQEIIKLLNLNSSDIIGDIHKGHRRIVMVRRIERLYRRQMGGYDALKRFISIVTSTSSRIMWVLQTNDIAFSFIDGIFGLGRMASRVLRIEPFRRKEMEEMLLHRLHFTGYRNFFLPDLELPDKTRRKLKDQKKLRTLFFDRIYELSLGYPLSAIFFTAHAVKRVSETTIFFRTPPTARFDALGALPEKLWFKGLIEARGFFPEEMAGQNMPVISLAESMGILERRYIGGGEILTARSTMEPFIRDILIDSGVIKGRGRSVIN